MRQKHRNQLFLLLASSQYGIDRFELKEYEENDSFTSDYLCMKDTPFCFVIRNHPEDYNSFYYSYTIYAPRFPSTDFYPENGYVSFDHVCSVISGWLDNQVNEYLTDEAEPDLWEEINNANVATNLDKIDFEGQSKFSFEERRQIDVSLKELKFLISNSLNITQEQQLLVSDRLDYLIEATERLNKFDWKGLALSTLISISVALSLDTSKGQLIFELFKNVFKTIRLIPE